ncbi:TPA: DNA-directed RNA polymerase subunit beta'' [Candidatus Gastranaerophilales bacterium HUM_6]|nr:dNA-directed RNA polymerase subunit beta' [Fusobacterium sp. CAG:815]DAA90031.1 MAG TPA: DNA-directed RNA polymerase subunit beta'' [Candidatus Gastranaerophilales bacterium HUM_6]DAA93792.1 MAG TPA: DNA-directed RNA polymerase subunit beta'' [Candidatus Gastranaerophilales bacterium HUM_7]DAB02410.1 MAG TPA: DNA-directed RNA polymerase subunit beta'' [Candidatus Gastranaerophilales bacterium HUM_12]DAB07337.1 MAG TPA: DNA-directed RNA polymerase subunit beta'' [Candidatus Gastranaerophilale
MENTYTHTKKSPDFINKQMDKGSLKKLLGQMYLEYGGAKAASLADALKHLGYKYATVSGTTISIADLSVPSIKKDLLKSAEEEIEKSTNRYLKGEITEVERYTKVIDTWSETTAKLTEQVVENFDKLNPVYMMAFSGARGNLSQVSQLVGMRGLMADAQGQIIDLPIKSNFKEGLSVTEYIISSYGARKGLVDTALKTADSGYLTRRLVDVAQDVIIRADDCHTEKYINMKPITDGDAVIVPLIDRLLGRTVAQDIVDADGNVLVANGKTMDRDDIKKISGLDLHELKVRSGLTCGLEYGVCQKCYGWAMTSQKLVDIGEAIGIIAAQSIGEPGTQLTMRTFHTGGAVGVKEAKKEIIAREAGKVVSKIKARELRTRHGDIVQVSMYEADIEVKGEKRTTKYHIPAGATLFITDGMEVAKGFKMAEHAPSSQSDSSRLTEKATKDITTDISGEVVFEDFKADEKKDRQGNVLRTTNKQGIVWVLGGDVYTLPGGSKVLVKDGQKISKGEKLAETLTICEHGGEVRVGDDLVVEEAKFDGKKIKKIVQGKELTIVIASLQPENASFEQTKKEQLWTVDKTGEKYIVKAPVDTTVENGMIIAELIDDDCTVSSSGEIRYVDVEVDENQIITKAGKVVFIPEEVHQINKDSTLKMVENGTTVTAGTEIVKDVYCHIDGVVEFKEYNDVIHEITVRPGEVHTLSNISELKVDEGEVVKKGTVIADGIKAKETSIVTIMDSTADELPIDDLDEEIDSSLSLDEDSIANQPVQILIRPVQVLEVNQKDVSIQFNTTDELIDIVPVTQLQYKDGARVRNVDGATITRTSLVLQMQGYLSHLKGMVELDSNGNLRIVVLENLIVRREIEGAANAALQTELLVKDGETIDPRTPVAKTQVLAVNDAVASIKNAEEDARRLLLISDSSSTTVSVKGTAVVKKGQFVKADKVLAESGETSPVSGLVTAVNKGKIQIRNGRPYLISPGTMLQIDSGALVLRGDLIATLVFEREKTGDIVQGLPKVEELLEGRKPKDCAILAENDGTAKIEIDDDGFPRLFLLDENGSSTEIKYAIDANVIVSNGQKITKGQPLTSGPMNPHDVMRLCGPEAAQQYLVDEVQRVYRSQGVEIADKHIEIIVRQMTKKVKITDAGDTKLLPGELIEMQTFEKENKAAEEAGKAPATCEYMLLGITKASLNTESFISAASFQETTRILTEAAVEGKKDLLRGLKENVIIGRLIPAGTGFHHLINANEERDREERKRAVAQRNQARKPSAILEEIEGMFGSPDFNNDDNH